MKNEKEFDYEPGGGEANNICLVSSFPNLCNCVRSVRVTAAVAAFTTIGTPPIYKSHTQRTKEKENITLPRNATRDTMLHQDISPTENATTAAERSSSRHIYESTAIVA